MQVTKRIALIFLSYLSVGLIALVFRVFSLGRFIHTDEANFWIDRSYRFLDAVQAGDMASTAISTHPGATTMWLGSAGIVLKRFLFEAGYITNVSFPIELTILRMPIVIVHVIGILIGFFLLRRLFSPLVAFLATVFWATSPFIIAYDRFLHVDGLTGTFAALSIIAACGHWNHGKNFLWLGGSAVAGALAMTSKSPGAAVVLVVLILSAVTISDTKRVESYVVSFLHALLPFAVWAIVCLATMMVVWPALWADPWRVVELVQVGVAVEGGSPHVIENYFLGENVPVPGFLYYPVVLAIRMTPWVLLGLLLLPWVWFAGHGRLFTYHRDLATFAGFALVFIIAMSFFPKKLDRYLVVIFPIINVLAALCVVWVFDRLTTFLVWIYSQWLAFARSVQLDRRLQYTRLQIVRKKPAMARWIPIARPEWFAFDEEMKQRLATRTMGTFIALMVGGAILNAALYHPYCIAYFNQLFGGTARGVQTVLIGEGEGLSEAAVWLNQQHNITGVTTTSTMVHTLQSFMKHGAQIVSEKGHELDRMTGYVVVYIRHMQRWGWGDDPPPPYNRFYNEMEPVKTVKIHGVDYVNIYEVPPEVDYEVKTDFADNVRLYGYSVDTSDIQETGVISLTTEWYARGPISKEYTMFAHVFNGQGKKVAQIDVAPAGAGLPTQLWETGRYIGWTHPIPVTKILPYGSYWFSIGLYDADNFARLPLLDEEEPLKGQSPSHSPSQPIDDGNHTLRLPALVQP